MTADEPQQRPASAEAALAELDAQEETTASLEPTIAMPLHVDRAATWRSVRAAPWFAPLAALAGIALLAALVVTLATGGNDRGAPSVAPSDAPLSQQLDRLDQAIDATR
jgi:hypothetical protein